MDLSSTIHPNSDFMVGDSCVSFPYTVMGGTRFAFNGDEFPCWSMLCVNEYLVLYSDSATVYDGNSCRLI